MFIGLERLLKALKIASSALEKGSLAGAWKAEEPASPPSRGLMDNCTWYVECSPKYMCLLNYDSIILV